MYHLPRSLRKFDTFFFFNDTATTEIYTLSLHDALPILVLGMVMRVEWPNDPSSATRPAGRDDCNQDRKSTRLNSSHLVISYAVFCLKKKNHPTRRKTSARASRQSTRDGCRRRNRAVMHL